MYFIWKEYSYTCLGKGWLQAPRHLGFCSCGEDHRIGHLSCTCHIWAAGEERKVCKTHHSHFHYGKLVCFRRPTQANIKAVTIPVAEVYPASTSNRTAPSIFLAVLPGWSHLWNTRRLNENEKSTRFPPTCFQAVVSLPCSPSLLLYFLSQMLISTVSKLTGRPLGIV